MGDYKRLVSWYVDCGRMGSLDGLFILDADAWADWKYSEAHGVEFWHGDVLGKHSEIVVTIDPEDYKVKSEDQEFIAKLEGLLGTHISGLNPLEEEALMIFKEDLEAE